MRIHWPKWLRRTKPEQNRTIVRPRSYMIRFIIGGKPYYMKWDAWERDSNDQWVLLTQEEMAQAIQEWIASDSWVTVGRGDANVAKFKTGAIEEYEVIDNSYFQADL